MASDPSKQNGRGRGRGRDEGKTPVEYTEAYNRDRDLNDKWWYRYDRILKGLSEQFRSYLVPLSGKKPSSLEWCQPGQTLSKPSDITRIFCIPRDSKKR